MKLTFNKDVIRFLCGEARHKFTRCEAFGFLYAMIAESKDKAYSVSCNLLAKEWRWDNHVVKDFLDELALAGILEIQRSTKIMTLSFTEKFREMAKEMQPIFSRLAQTNRKASKIEAFFYVIQEVASQDHRAGDSISFRSIAKKLGWSHHTVVSLLSYMKENNIIIQSPADDSRMLELGWA